MSEQKIFCFIGPEMIEQERMVAKKLKTEIERLIKQGVTGFNIAAGRKLDTMAALHILRLKLNYPGVKLHYIVPGLDKVITAENSFINNRLIYNADTLKIVEAEEQTNRIFKNAGFCISLSGGHQAQKQGITIIPLDP